MQIKQQLIDKPKRRLGLIFMLTAFFLAALSITSAHGQSYQQTSQKDAFTWGIKAGVNLSYLHGDDVVGSDVRTGFSGGVFFNYRFNDYLAIQPEVIFNERGADLNSGLTGENGAVGYDLGYLIVPALVKFYIPTGSFVTPNIYAGPQVAFALYGNANDSNINDKLKTAAFGAAFGVGVNFDVGSFPESTFRTVGLDLRYSLGLTNVFDTPNEPEARNGAFLVALFVGF